MEIWKPISGYESLYEVSNYGNIRDAKYKYSLKLYRHNAGYLYIPLYDCNGAKKYYLVHRLVADAFLPNPDSLPVVHHIDEDKHNNNVANLVRCSYIKHRHCHNSRNNAYNEARKKPVVCVETGVVYESVREARRQTGAHNINKVLAGQKRTSGGFHWKYI